MVIKQLSNNKNRDKPPEKSLPQFVAGSIPRKP